MVFVRPDLGSLLRGLLDPRAELGRVAAEVNLPFRCAAVFLQVPVRAAANFLRHERTANAAENGFRVRGADLVEELGVKRLNGFRETSVGHYAIIRSVCTLCV